MSALLVCAIVAAMNSPVLYVKTAFQLGTDSTLPTLPAGPIFATPKPKPAPEAAAVPMETDGGAAGPPPKAEDLD